MHADSQGTNSAKKNEILFSRFGINYNNELEMFKKGTVIARDVQSRGRHKQDGQSARQLERDQKKISKAKIETLHIDIIGDEFWASWPL